MTPSGQTYICYHNVDCSGSLDTVDSYNFDGADVIEYNVLTCSANVGHATHYVQHNDSGDISCGYSTAGTPIVSIEVVASSGPATVIVPDAIQTRTLTTYNSTGKGASACNPSSSFFYNLFGNNEQTLSVEDTESDAIARIPGIGTWSDYTSCGGDPLCCRTAWQLRGAGQFSFEYVESRIKVQGGTSLASQHVSVSVELWRRAYGSGSYALYQTLEDDTTSDGSKFFSVDFGVVNNTAGFETICLNCKVNVIV